MRVTSKGQVTIPQHLRRQAKIRSGSEVEFSKRGEELILRRAAPRKRETARADEFETYLDQVTGIVDIGMTTDEFMDLLRGE